MRDEEVADFRSDTITRPPAEMLTAMVVAEVGDDVLGDDPTVQELERVAAQLCAREAALFVASGTMGNQVSVCTSTTPGDEVLVHAEAHIFNYEAGALARIGGVQARALPGLEGRMHLESLEMAIRPDDVHCPPTALICLEQTHMSSGGRVLPLKYLREVRALARAHDLKVHIDGARIFNASVAAGIPVAEYASCCDSLTFCLSKGLSAPIGSIVVGDREFITRARRWRKMLGGGMRQAGYLAACGLYALDHMVERLADDHRRAKRLAEGLAELRSCTVMPDQVETNLCIVKTERGAAPRLAASLEERGVRALALGPGTLRFVTHRHIDDSHVGRALEAMRSL